MTTKYFDLNKHLAQEHHMSPFSTYLKEIVYGGNDGIVTTFAIVAGFSGAQAQIATLPIFVVLLFGFANLAADGISMALGNFLSIRSEQDVYKMYKARELHEIRTNKDQEIAESVEILIRRGFNETQAKELVKIYATNEKYWLEFMMNDELSLHNPEGEKPHIMSLVTFFSFVSFGLIPLLPYVFLPEAPEYFLYSCIFTLGALLLVGILRWKVSGTTWLRSIGETLLMGSTAAIIAYLVGTWFRV